MPQRHSLATKQKISRAQKGKNNSMYGKRHSRETLRKISRINKGKNNPMYGKHHSPEALRKMSLAARRRMARLRAS